MANSSNASAFLKKHGISDNPSFAEKLYHVYMIGFEPNEKDMGLTQSIDYLDTTQIIANTIIVIKKAEREVAVWMYNEDDPVEYGYKPYDFIWNGAMENPSGPYLLAKNIIDDSAEPLEKAKRAAEKKVAKALTDKVGEWKTIKNNKMIFNKIPRMEDTVALKKIVQNQSVVAEKSASTNVSLLPAARDLQEAMNDFAAGQEAVAILRKGKASHLFVTMGSKMACLSFKVGKGKKGCKDIKALIPKAKSFLAAA